MLTGAAWAAVIPIHEAAVTELSPAHRTARGMSLLANAALAGGAVGAAAAGALYGATSWGAVCVALSGVLAVCAVAGPWVLRRIGLRDRPTTPSEPDRATEA